MSYCYIVQRYDWWGWGEEYYWDVPKQEFSSKKYHLDDPQKVSKFRNWVKIYVKKFMSELCTCTICALLGIQWFSCLLPNDCATTYLTINEKLFEWLAQTRRLIRNQNGIIPSLCTKNQNNFSAAILWTDRCKYVLTKMVL